MQQLSDALGIRRFVLERPELRRQRAWRRLEQDRQIDVIGAKAHAVFAQRRARRLVETLDLFRDFLTLEHAKRFDQLERNAARHAGDVVGRGQREQRRQQLFDMGLEPKVEAGLHQLFRRTGQMVVGNDAHARPQRVVAGHQFADSLAGPSQGAVIGQDDLVVRGLRQFGRTRLDLAGQCLLRGGVERLGFRAGGGGIRCEHESIEPADHVAFDRHIARFTDFSFQHRVLS